MNTNTQAFSTIDDKAQKFGVPERNSHDVFNPLPLKNRPQKVAKYLSNDGDYIHISKTLGDSHGLWWLRYSGKKINY